MQDENVTILRGLVTTEHLCKMFSRSQLTIILWRKHSGLPYIRIPGTGRDTIRYKKSDVLEWANENDKRIHLTDED